MESFVREQVFAGWSPRRNHWRPFIPHSTRPVGLQTLTQRREITIITSHIPGNGACLAALSDLVIGRVPRLVTARPLGLGAAQANRRCRLQSSPRELFCSRLLLDDFSIQDSHKSERSGCRKFTWVQKGLGWIPEGKTSLESC